MHKFIAVCNLVLMFNMGCEPQKSIINETDDIKQLIAETSRLFSQSYVQGDTTTLGHLYTMDAVLLPPGREIKGRESIKEYFSPSPRRRNISHSMESQELVIQGSTAIDMGTWHNSWQIEEGEVQSASDRYLVVWILQEDGQWRIRYDMWH